MKTQRCGWCSDDPLYIAYHDENGANRNMTKHVYLKCFALKVSKLVYLGLLY